MQDEMTVKVVGGLVTGLFFLIHAIQNRRLGKLEDKVDEVKAPNVGMAMCDQRYGTLSEAVRYFSEEMKEARKTMERHGKLLERVDANMESLIKHQNNRG